MSWLNSHLLSAILWSPLIGILPLFLTSRAVLQRGIALFFSLIPLGLSVVLFLQFEGKGGYQFQEVSPWIKEFHIFYRLGVDGISLSLILLTALLVPISVLSSWREIAKKTQSFYLFFLLLETGMFGVFLSLDLFLFYLFWEIVLIPMYFLIGIWGGERRIEAAIKFVLYTLFGSLLMLAAILYLYFISGETFNFEELSLTSLSWSIQIPLFAAFALAFAIKVPLFPFHTWLPDAHVQAPTAGSVILAGLLLKMGTYGFIRIAMPFFPLATGSFLPLIKILSVIGILYGALVAMVQTDLKKLVAYSSVSHLGFVVLGLASLTTEGMMGATLQMVNHGISTGALFLLVGMIYERRHTKEIAQFGGLAHSMPIYTTIFLIVTLSSLALPGTNGFVGEFLILIGTFRESPLFASLAGLGVILAAVYLLWMFRRVFFGPISQEVNRHLPDLSWRELLVMVPLLIGILWIGIKPDFLLKKMEPSIRQIQERVVQRA